MSGFFYVFTQKKYLISIFSAIKIYTLKKANFHINIVNSIFYIIK